MITESPNTRLDFADALRGYAILGVMLVHCWIILNPLNLPEWLKTISLGGSFGVQLFFIASAFTLLYSLTYAHNAQEGGRNFFIRRIFRILPMFYIAIILYSILLIINPFPIIGTSNIDATIPNIVSHFSFIFALDPIHINTLVPGGWSIATEMMFYITIPIIYTFVKKPLHAGFLLLGCITANMILMMSISKSRIVTANPSYFSFWLPNQFPVFCMGVLLFIILKEIMFNTDIITKLSQIQKQGLSSICILLSVGLAYYSLFVYQSSPNGIIKLYLISFAFMIFALGLAIYQSKLLVNRFTTYLGKISYSCYLLHFIIISLICKLIPALNNNISIAVFGIFYIVVIISTMALSSFTYHYIELPGISIGKQLIKILK